MYTPIGFVIGTVIDCIRGFIARPGVNVSAGVPAHLIRGEPRRWCSLAAEAEFIPLKTVLALRTQR
jgi:hypothetical protein